MLNNIAAITNSGAAAAVGDYESISTTTVGSGGTSTVTFSSIPSTYSHLQLRIIGNVSTADSIIMRFNGDSGSNYARHRLVGDGSTVSAASSTTTTSIAISSSPGFPSNANIFGGSILDILDYASTNKNKTTRNLFGVDKNGSGGVTFESGLWFATPAAITSITLTPASGTINQYSSFALYGIK
jgi:hypothetical protein